MARKDSSPRPASAKARAREAARLEAERLKAEREARARRQRQRNLAFLSAGIVTVVALAVAVYMAIPRGGVEGVEAKPAGADSTGGILIGRDGTAGSEAPSASEAVTVEIYSDYMCPYCGKLEQGISGALDQLREDGEVRVVLHPVAFLDRFSNDTQYSTRSLNHSATVARDQPEKFLAFHKALFANQPEENSDGLTDEEMVTIATDIGVSEEVTAKFSTMELNEWVEGATQSAANAGVTGTPDVYLTAPGGKKVRWTSALSGDIKGAVAKVKAGEDPNI
jgi:protein-disulfide isomerase